MWAHISLLTLCNRIIYSGPVSQTCVHAFKYHGLSTCHTSIKSGYTQPGEAKITAPDEKRQDECLVHLSIPNTYLCLEPSRSSLNVHLRLSLKSRKIKVPSQAFTASVLRCVRCYPCTHQEAMIWYEAGNACAWAMELSYWPAWNSHHCIPLG